MVSSAANQKVEEALVILEALQASPELQQPLAAAMLLALAGLEPFGAWTAVTRPMLGVTEIMNFAKRRYGFENEPEAREFLQKHALKFLVDRRLVLVNPDNPERSASSRFCVYQLEPTFASLLKSFGTETYSAALDRLRHRNTGPVIAAEGRSQGHTAVMLPSGEEIWLLRDSASEFTRSLLEVFCPKFAPGGNVVHVGGVAPSHSLSRRENLKDYGFDVDPALDLPDLIVHGPTKNRFVLVDITHRRGPIDDQRRKDLEKAFGGPGRRLVMVTAFRSRLDLVRTMDRISSDTSVWIVESPFRLISVQSGSGEHHAEGPSALDVGQRDAWARLETHKPNRDA